MIGPLAELYQKLISGLSQERRLRLFRRVSGLVQNTGIVSVNAFLPFIAEDNAHAIVAMAVIDFVSFGILTNGDEMSRVRDIIGMIESGQLNNEGAAFGGLLCLGDDRVCTLLAPLRDQLDWSAIKVATNCSTGLTHAAVVEFYIDWMESLDADDPCGVFGLLASALILVRRQDPAGMVLTGRRPFPLRLPGQQERGRRVHSLEVSSYADRIAPRLLALERTEPKPRIMPHVLKAWGLPPRTDSAEAVSLAWQ